MKDAQKHEKDENVKMWRGGESNKDKKLRREEKTKSDEDVMESQPRKCWEEWMKKLNCNVFLDDISNSEKRRR